MAKRMRVYFLDYNVDGKSTAAKIFRQKKLSSRRTLKKYPLKGNSQRVLVEMTIKNADYDLFVDCIRELIATAPQPIRESDLTVEQVLHKNLLLL